MPLELTGRIIEIQEPETGTTSAGKTWIKQLFVIHYGDEIERDTAFSVMGDARIAQLERCEIGDTVKVAFSANSSQGRSASTQGRWFTDLNAFRIENISYPNGHPQTANTTPAAHPVQQAAAPAAPKEEAAPAASAPKSKSSVEMPSEAFQAEDDDSGLPF